MALRNSKKLFTIVKCGSKSVEIDGIKIDVPAKYVLTRFRPADLNKDNGPVILEPIKYSHLMLGLQDEYKSEAVF